jgi:signal transduction histidine kinase
VVRECEDGRLLLLTKADTYLRSSTFIPDDMIGFIHQLETKALADGMAGLRLAGEMTWALGDASGCDRIIEYEALLNRFLLDSRSTVLCQYDFSRFDRSCIHDVLLTHPLAVLGQQVCPNPYYEPPELVLCNDLRTTAEFKAMRVDWWIAQLERAREAAQERERLVEKLQALSRQLIEVQESERRHLARELHDEIGQTLTVLKLLVQAQGDLALDQVKTRFEPVRGIVDELLERIRSLSFDLRPTVLDELGLLPALLALFERFTSQTGLEIRFKQDGIDGHFAPEIETTAYRIAQEALTNVARHAKVDEVVMRAWRSDDSLNLQIEDHGIGFDPEATMATAMTRGLAGMRERVSLVGGRLVIESRTGFGTQLTAQLPFLGASSG